MDPVSCSTFKTNSRVKGIECRFAHSAEELDRVTQVEAKGNVLLVRDCRKGATGKAPPAKGQSG